MARHSRPEALVEELVKKVSAVSGSWSLKSTICFGVFTSQVSRGAANGICAQPLNLKKRDPLDSFLYEVPCNVGFLPFPNHDTLPWASVCKAWPWIPASLSKEGWTQEQSR